jgi:hypothetical protein
MNESMGEIRSDHRRILAACWIVYGVLRLILALWLFLYRGTATVMFGALLNRVPDPFAMMSDFHMLFAALVVLSVLCGIFGLLAGLALLANQRSARALALLAAFFSVSEIPFGTTLGIYTLIAFLPSWGVSSANRSPKLAS